MLPIDRIAQTMAFIEPVMDHLSVQVAYTYPLSLTQGLESVSGLKILPCLDWDSNPVPTSLITDCLDLYATEAGNSYNKSTKS